MEERMEILKKVIEFASMAYEKPADEISGETNVSEELGVKSIQRVAFVAGIENEYDVMIPVSRIAQFKTINDVVEFIIEEM